MLPEANYQGDLSPKICPIIVRECRRVVTVCVGKTSMVRRVTIMINGNAYHPIHTRNDWMEMIVFVGSLSK